MDKKSKKILLTALFVILVSIGAFMGLKYPNEPINNTIAEYQNILVDKIIELDENVVVDITENESISSDVENIEVVTNTDEAKLEEEFLTEEESLELQGEISYDGEHAQSWNIETGDYKGLTYYSQIDSRWKNILYTSTNNKTQTIGSSGCGPTSAAMVVSSIKGEITPDVMAKNFVKYGYRSANSGTYWSAFRAVADEFNIGYTETSDIQRALQLLENKNYVIVSCGNGLFTTGGHYIAIVGIEGNTFKIYDPYLYNGKFEISTRRGKVVVSGNTVYCSVDNFKKYANYKQFFCYQDIEHSNYKSGETIFINMPVAIAYNNGTKSIVDCNGNQFWISNINIKNGHIQGQAIVCFDGGYTDIVQLGLEQFWCNEKYMNTIQTVQKVNSTEQQLSSSTVGQIRKLKQNCIIYSNQNLNGLKFNYRTNTSIKILKNINNDIDYIQVIQTGRKGYINNNNYR